MNITDYSAYLEDLNDAEIAILWYFYRREKMIMNGIISKCSHYETCRDLWERNVNDNRNMPPFTCKECVGYECYCIGFSGGAKQAIDVVKGE